MSVAQRISQILAAVTLVSAAVCSSANAAEKPVQLRVSNDWAAYSRQTPDGHVCYAMTKMSSSSPKNLRRDPAYLLVNIWPGRKDSTEVQIVPGYSFKKGADLTASVDRLSVQLFSKESGGETSAWVKRLSDEDRLIRAMKHGSSLQVSGVSSRGTKITDTFSLKGISAMISYAEKHCSR